MVAGAPKQARLSPCALYTRATALVLPRATKESLTGPRRYDLVALTDSRDVVFQAPIMAAAGTGHTWSQGTLYAAQERKWLALDKCGKLAV